jgi:hypothetical protein
MFWDYGGIPEFERMRRRFISAAARMIFEVDRLLMQFPCPKQPLCSANSWHQQDYDPDHEIMEILRGKISIDRLAKFSSPTGIGGDSSPLASFPAR